MAHIGYSNNTIPCISFEVKEHQSYFIQLIIIISQAQPITGIRCRTSVLILCELISESMLHKFHATTTQAYAEDYASI